MMRRLLAAFLLLIPLVAVSADFDVGFAAYERGDYQTALQEWLPLAEQGDAFTQYSLGVMYDLGKGVPQDDEEAVKWYRLAAEQGYAAAQNNIGFMYDEGEGVPMDDTEAVMWYRLAAEQGHSNAQYNLGVMYENGEGVPQFHAEAVKWYRAAAKQGDQDAKDAISQLVNKGVIRSDERPAQVPSSSGPSYFAVGLAAYDRGDYQAAMKEWRPHAEQGGVAAQYYLGEMYQYGRGVPQQNSEAAKWYRLAAKQGYSRAQRALKLLPGNGSIADTPSSSGPSYFAVGLAAYDRGDYQAAMKEWRPHAEQGGVAAQYYLGEMYQYGRGVPQQNSEAAKWYRLAAKQGYSRAQRALEHLPSNGSIADTPSKQPNVDPDETISHAQRLLGQLGYYRESINGLLGKQTRNATLAFQRDYKLVETGTITDEFILLLQIAVVSNSSNPTPTPAPAPELYKLKGTGSGFAVNPDGGILTNFHVVEDCDKLTVNDDVEAEFQAADEQDDLAYLRVTKGFQGHAAFTSKANPTLGQTATVAGYPLTGILSSGLNLTTGSVSAVAGLGNNPKLMQITAPIQSGNSGGPILDDSGNVIGVVVSKLSSKWMFENVGVIPQNVNFAIKSLVAKTFMDINGLPYSESSLTKAKTLEEIGEAAQEFTVSVQCHVRVK